MLYFFDNARKYRSASPPPSILQPVALKAPCLIERWLSFKIKSFETSEYTPSPKHFGQAPYGALNENNLGVTSSSVQPQYGQA